MGLPAELFGGRGPTRWRKVSDTVAGFLRADGKLAPIYAARYIAVNNKYDFLPKQLEDKGMTIVADIAQVLRDARDTMDSGDNDR